MALTDARLEALTSIHQLESLKETLGKLQMEVNTLREDNSRLNQVISNGGMVPPPSMTVTAVGKSAQPLMAPSKLQITEQKVPINDDEMLIPDLSEIYLVDPGEDKEGKRVNITVCLGGHGIYEKYINPSSDSGAQECVIGAVTVSGKTNWTILDNLIKRVFNCYLLRIDPIFHLGITADSISSYHLGEISRSFEKDAPELLPYGYIIGEVSNIKIILKGASSACVDALAFESLIPKQTLQKYVSLLLEHRRLVISGSSGTGKTFLANRLAEFLVVKGGKDVNQTNIATLR